MQILKILFQGIRKTELKKEFFYIITISLIAAIFELLGVGAFSYLVTIIFSEGELTNNIFSSMVNLDKLDLNKNQVVIIFVVLFIINILVSFLCNYLIQKMIAKNIFILEHLYLMSILKKN